MELGMTQEVLGRENRVFMGTGGRSQENRSCGFSPAFMDVQTQMVYPSRYVDGRLAPFHLLDGLPDELVMARHDSGRVVSVKPSIISGFLRDGRFFTREEAAQEVNQLVS